MNSEYNENEVDLVNTSQCPFNKSHVITAASKYKYHLQSCKDQHFTHIASRIVRCRHNQFHRFITREELQYHEPRCRNHPQRPELKRAVWGKPQKRIQYEKCPYYEYHEVVKSKKRPQLLQQHMDNCPYKDNPYNLEERIKSACVKDMTEQGIRNAAHGHVPYELVARSTVRKNPETIINLPFITICYREKQFTAQIQLFPSKKFDEKVLYIDYSEQLDQNEYPYLQIVQNNKTHQQHLVALLSIDNSQNMSKVWFPRFKEFLQSKNNLIAISQRKAGSENIVYVVMAHSNANEFALNVPPDKVGLFQFEHSILLGNDSNHELVQKYYELGNIIEEQVSNLEMYTTECNKKQDNISNLDFQYEQLSAQVEQLRQKFLISKEKLESTRISGIEKNEKADQLCAQAKLALQASQEQLEQVKREGEGEIAALEHQIQIERQRSEQMIENLIEKQRKRQQSMPAPPTVPQTEENQQRACIMCFENLINTMFIPCGHRMYCNSCAYTINLHVNKRIPNNHKAKKCPLCNCEVTKLVNCFLQQQYQAFSNSSLQSVKSFFSIRG